MSTGDVVDAELSDEPQFQEPAPVEERVTPRRSRSHRRSEDTEPDKPREAKAGPPSLDEWTKFFSKIVLRVVCDWYLSFAFRGIDEDMLSDREIERLAMTADERQTIAVPFAELSNKSKFMRKHGRTIVSSGDAFNAMVVMGAWMSRVNRIANKYRKRDVRVNGANINGSSGPGPATAGQNGNSNGAFVGTHGGRFPDGFNGTLHNPGSG